MNKQLFFTALLMLVVVLSASVVCASDVNVIDSYATSLVDDTLDVSVSNGNDAGSSEILASSASNVDNDTSKVSLSSEEVLETDNSNALSTYENSNSDDDIGDYVASNDIVLSAVSNDVASESASKNLANSDDSILAKSNGNTVLNTVYKGNNLIATLTDGEGNPISGAKVGFANNGVTYIRTDENGQAKYSTKGLANGKYTIKVKFYGDDVYGASNQAIAKVSVNKVATRLTSANVKVISGTDGYLVASLRDANGKPVKGVRVGFANNGVKYVVTDANGLAKYSTKGLAAGTYTVKMKFYGDDTYGASNQAVAKITVNKMVTRLSSKVYYNGNGYLVASLRDVYGNPISGAKVGFANNGVKYVLTDANGLAKYSTKGLSDGKYSIKMKFYGTNSLGVSNQAVAELSVSKVATKLTSADVNVYVGSDSYLVATLKDENGKPVSGAKVGFANNGVKYVLTDANGQAKYSTKDLAAGTYDVRMKFYGDDTYGESDQAIAKVTVSKVATRLTSADVKVISGTDGYLVATLRDANGKPVSGAKVGFANNGVKYVVTDANGQAKYPTNDLAVGTYAVKMKFYGDNKYVESNQISAKVTVSVSNGYFVFGKDMINVDLNKLASNGVTDLFLNYYAVKKVHDQPTVETWIASANNLGIKVHIWMQIFLDDETSGWVNPIIGGSYNTGFSNHKITEAQHYAKIRGVSGILLDYLRYPGNAYKTPGSTVAISNFTKMITDEIHKINPNLIVSAALMPETTESEYYYGQDYYTISGIVDVVMPMVYKGNYHKTSSWIEPTAKWYVDNSNGAKVWTILMGYRSDEDSTLLSASELAVDIKSAISAGSNGVFLFRYGASNLINFNDLNSYSNKAPDSISIYDILYGASNLKTYYENNRALPDTVTAAGYAFTVPEFFYLMSQAIYQLGNDDMSAIKCLYGVAAPENPHGDQVSTDLYKANYLLLAKNAANYVKEHKQAPNYSTGRDIKIKYDYVVDMYSRILVYYKNNNRLPDSVSINTYDRNTGPVSISIDNILTGANYLKTYYEDNGALPRTVTAAGHAFTLPEFFYLMSQAIYQLGDNDLSAIRCLYGVAAPENPYGDSANLDLSRASYVLLAKNAANYVKEHKQAPNWSRTGDVRVKYDNVLYLYSRILVEYKNNNRLPDSIPLKTFGLISVSSSYSMDDVNVMNTISDLSPYYNATSNCQVNDAAIKKLVNSLTADLTDDKEIATVLYDYVRDQVLYSYYNDTKYGAVGTLNAQTGNNVDQAHLLVAMYRTAGLAARYEQGTCYFPLSGNTNEHVWVQVLIGDMWVVADPTSTRNSFGDIVNWNTDSYTHNEYYASLPF